MGENDGTDRRKRAMAEPASFPLRGQPIHIAAIKEAVGIDTFACTFEMGMLHLEKTLEQLKEEEKSQCH